MSSPGLWYIVKLMSLRRGRREEKDCPDSQILSPLLGLQDLGLSNSSTPVGGRNKGLLPSFTGAVVLPCPQS